MQVSLSHLPLMIICTFASWFVYCKSCNVKSSLFNIVGFLLFVLFASVSWPEYASFGCCAWGWKSIGRRPFGASADGWFLHGFSLLRCHNLLCAYDVFIEGLVVLNGLGEGIKRNADEKRMMIIFFRLHFNYSSFFNSSISGNACFNFSGISSEVLYVATPKGLS